MNDVVGQYDEAGIPVMDQQPLVGRSVPGRGNQRDAPMVEYIGITIDALTVLQRSKDCQIILGQAKRLVDYVARAGH